MHLWDEWHFILYSTQRYFWLRPSQDFCKEFSRTRREAWWMKRMQRCSHKSLGFRPSTQSCYVPPAGTGQWENRKSRPPTGLVKVVCLPFDGAAAQRHGRRKPTDASFETMLGRSSWVDSLFVWFPASWMPLVVDAVREKSFAYNQVVSQLGAVAFTDQTHTVLPEGLDFTYNVKRWQADARGCCPVRHASMLTGSPLTRKCLPPSFLDSKKAFFGMCSYRKRLWPGTTPLLIASW